MGINIPASSSLGSIFHIFFPFFFFSANMNLTVFAGILHAITMATARRASLGEKTMQAASEADEPDKAKRVKRNANCLMRFDGHCTKNEQCCSRRCNVIAGKRGKQWLYRCDHYNGL